MAAATRPAPALIRFADRDWYDLGAWGGANGLSLTWNRPTKRAQLTNQVARAGFAVDSQQCVINGVKVWLSWPITPRGTNLLVAALDVDSVLVPLLVPAPSRPPRKLRTIVLDPGHGGKDPGNQAGSEQEKRYTLLLAQQVRAKLQAAGYQVLLTRSRDRTVGLGERVALANRVKADLFFSLHFNSFDAGAPGVQGVETYCLTPDTAPSTHPPPTSNPTNPTEPLPGNAVGRQSLVLAYHLQRAVVRRVGMADRGVKRARFAVLRDAAMPSVLLEAGFMSATSDLPKITDAASRNRMADAVLEAIRAYAQQTGN